MLKLGLISCEYVWIEANGDLFIGTNPLVARSTLFWQDAYSGCEYLGEL